MATFREKENYCRRTFDENGPYWHLYTSGKETPLMFRTEDDYVFAMNVIAQMAFEYHDIRILTFEIMGNHIHILAEGHSDRLLTAFTFLKKRLTRGMKESFPGGLHQRNQRVAQDPVTASVSYGRLYVGHSVVKRTAAWRLDERDGILQLLRRGVVVDLDVGAADLHHSADGAALVDCHCRSASSSEPLRKEECHSYDHCRCQAYPQQTGDKKSCHCFLALR